MPIVASAYTISCDRAVCKPDDHGWTQPGATKPLTIQGTRAQAMKEARQRGWETCHRASGREGRDLGGWWCPKHTQEALRDKRIVAAHMPDLTGPAPRCKCGWAGVTTDDAEKARGEHRGHLRSKLSAA